MTRFHSVLLTYLLTANPYYILMYITNRPPPIYKAHSKRQVERREDAVEIWSPLLT